jgi:hypothetical protein
MASLLMTFLYDYGTLQSRLGRGRMIASIALRKSRRPQLTMERLGTILG